MKQGELQGHLILKLLSVLSGVVLGGLLLGFASSAALADQAPESARYAGSPACASCHREEFQNFQTLSKKAVTRRQVEKLLPKLSGEEQTTCFRCHATGYGKAGGFVSYAQTPGLGDVGCESCHGPGSAHIEEMSREPAERGSSRLITRRPAAETCASCHTPARGGVKPLFSGAH